MMMTTTTTRRRQRSVPALLLFLLLAVVGTTEAKARATNVVPDLVVTEHNHAQERRMLKAFDGILEKYDPAQDYGSGGFLGSLPNNAGGVRKGGKHGRELIVPLAFLGLTQAISSGLQIFSTLVGLFGRTYQEALVATHLDNGYSKMKGHTHVFKGKGLPYSRIPEFVEYMADVADMQSKESREGLAFQLRWAEYGDGDMWKENQFTFNVGKGGMVKTFTLYINNDHLQSKLNIVTMTTDVSFKLAPDVFVILGMTSRFGGLMSSTSIRKVRKPQNVKDKHITFTNEYFQLIGLQLLSDLLNLGQAPRDPDFGKRLPSNVKDPRPGFDDVRREGNVPPDQFRLPPRLEPSSVQQDQGVRPGYGNPGYGDAPPAQEESYPPAPGGADCSNPMSPCYGGGDDSGASGDGYNNNPMDDGSSNSPMDCSNPMSPCYGEGDDSGASDNGYNNDPVDGGYPTHGMEPVEDDDRRGGGKGRERRKRRKKDVSERRKKKPRRKRKISHRKPNRPRRRRRNGGRNRRRRSKRRNGGRKKSRRRSRRRNRKGNRKLRGAPRLTFPSSDRSVLSAKCESVMCPSIGCAGEVQYRSRMDCCGTCMKEEEEDVSFPTTDYASLSPRCYSVMCQQMACFGDRWYRNENDCCGTCSGLPHVSPRRI